MGVLCSSCGAQASHCGDFSSCDPQAHFTALGLKSRGAWAELLHSRKMEPVSPALAGCFFTTEPPWRPQQVFCNQNLAMVNRHVGPIWDKIKVSESAGVTYLSVLEDSREHAPGHPDGLISL